MTMLFSVVLIWSCTSNPDSSSKATSLTSTNSALHEVSGQRPVVGEPDSDGDGAPDAVDCAPNDRYSFPGAVEHCDGRRVQG